MTLNQRSPNFFYEVLAQLRWDESHAIPIANEENQALIHRLDQLQRQFFQRSAEVDDEKSKVQQLKDHIKNVKQETDNICSICQMRGNVIDTETHQLKTAEQEQDRLRQEIRRISKLRENIREKTSHLENLAFQKRNELQKVTSAQGANNEALSAWIQKLEARNDDMKSLQKFIKEDDSKLKELNLELEHLTSKRLEKKAKLDNLYTKSIENQVALNRFGQEISMAYVERGQVLAQWESVVARMRQQDRDIRNLTEMVNECRLKLTEAEESNQEKGSFLQEQQQSTIQAQRHSDEIANTIGKTRIELAESEVKRQNFFSELEAFKRTVDRLASDLESTRINISQMKKEKARKTEKLQQLQVTLGALEEKLAYVVDSKRSAEQLADEADASLTAAEASHEQMTRMLDKLRSDRFKATQNYENLSGESKRLNQQLQGANAILRIAKSNLSDLDSKLMAQHEVMYKQDFKIQQLDRRIARMLGEQIEDSSELLQEQVRTLETQLDERTNTVNYLSGELANIRREVHRRKREVQDLSEIRTVTETKLQHDDLEVTAAVKHKSKLTNVIQRLTVDLNLVRLEVRRLFKNYEKSSDKVFCLEAAREELDCAIKQHLEQLSLRHKMLTSEARMASEDNSKLKMEIQSRKSHVEILIKRYEILTALMAPPEGEEERSQTYYVIKAAQDKEALQRKGDQLDAETRQAEQELIALENTLALMNGCNTLLRHSYAKLPDDAEELTQMKELKEQLRLLSIKQRYDQVRLDELQETERAKLECKSNLEAELELYKQQNQQLTTELDRKSRDIDTQKARYNRSLKRMQKLQNNITKKQILDAEQHEAVLGDIKVRMIRELADRMIQELLARTRANTQMNDQAQTLLSASGLRFSTLGERRVSRASMNSNSSSARSPTTSSLSTSAGSGTTSPCPSQQECRASSARSVETVSARSDLSEADVSQKPKKEPKTVRSVDLGQQALLPGEVRSKSGSQSSRSATSEKSGSSTERTTHEM
ncbi:Coiled-coil domain-containing protein 39 [Clonorchis sinensis]|uniref:Coiled-coil domain-containing protein 39 n=1 Tax=Clonorchis sinensis TaxID=79923 RepID=A0A419PZG6_CLOSI|nr:Coiled-coil domain-containing protein 39 [Clonorchis sinensis]